MPRHFLFGSNPYQGLQVVRPHFLPWIRAVEPRVFQTNSKQREFSVRVANDVNGDLEVSLQSGSQLIIPSRRWKYYIFKFIQAPDLDEGFGGHYLIPLVKQFFEHLKENCGCFESPPVVQEPTPSRCKGGIWERGL